jgi:5-methylcytosine-specific restriction endonuclease McrA
VPEAYAFSRHQIDHTVAEKHGGATQLENLALCCMLCNLHKGSDLSAIDPESGEITRLFHPRTNQWAEHFRLASDGHLEGTSSIGRATIRLLQLDRLDRVEERRLLLAYGLWES